MHVNMFQMLLFIICPTDKNAKCHENKCKD